MDPAYKKRKFVCHRVSSVRKFRGFSLVIFLSSNARLCGEWQWKRARMKQRCGIEKGNEELEIEMQIA